MDRQREIKKIDEKRDRATNVQTSLETELKIKRNNILKLQRKR